MCSLVCESWLSGPCGHLAASGVVWKAAAGASSGSFGQVLGASPDLLNTPGAGLMSCALKLEKLCCRDQGPLPGSQGRPI